MRPDFVSAAVMARASGKRVEVLSARTGSSRSWVLPSGLVEAEDTGEVRFKDPTTTDNDGWRDIDLALKHVGGSVVPTAAPGAVRLSAGGDGGELVSFTDADGQSVSVGAGLAGVRLPTPRLEGPVASYVDVLPGVDVRVEVRTSGFEQLWVVKDRAGLANLVKARASGGSVGLEPGLSIGRLSARPEEDGSVVFTTAKGKAAGRLRAPSMWDGVLDPGSGEPVNVARVAFEVSAGGRPVTAKDPARSGRLGLRVKADRGWLTDPARVFPITIDPTYASGSANPSFDTFVQEGYGTDQSGATELKLGDNGSGQLARSYLNFSAAALLGKKIMSGKLELWETWSWNCSAKGWTASNAGTASASTRIYQRR